MTRPVRTWVQFHEMLEAADGSTGSCWQWQRGLNMPAHLGGTGQVVHPTGARFPAPRVALCWSLGLDPLDVPARSPDGQRVVTRHHCRTLSTCPLEHQQLCVNPDHLSFGSDLDNYHDDRDLHAQARRIGSRLGGLNSRRGTAQQQSQTTMEKP